MHAKMAYLPGSRLRRRQVLRLVLHPRRPITEASCHTCNGSAVLDRHTYAGKGDHAVVARKLFATAGPELRKISAARLPIRPSCPFWTEAVLRHVEAHVPAEPSQTPHTPLQVGFSGQSCCPASSSLMVQC